VLLHDILTSTQTAPKISRLKQSSLIGPVGKGCFLNGLFNGYCSSGLFPVVSIGLDLSRASLWSGIGRKSEAFFLSPAPSAGALRAERSGITTASGTPNLITAFTSPCPVRRWSHRWHKKLLAATPLEIQPYSLQQAIVRFRMKWER
jgi:hypothetical protein